jgi:predicted nucleic acid-binding protein
MIVVSDTTVLTTLMKCGKESLLREMYGSVVIPQAVFDELIVFHPNIPVFVERRIVTKFRELPTSGLGRGETEAILIALELKADLLISDDRRARSAAGKLGLAYSGLLGIALDAKGKGLVFSVKELIELFEKKGGLYVSARLKANALQSAGE